MADDAALRSALVWLAAVIAAVGLGTHSFKKMLATYVVGMFGIAGILLPDWDFFDRDFSKWTTPLTAEERAAMASARRSRLSRFRIYPLRLIIYTGVYGFGFYKWWSYSQINRRRKGIGRQLGGDMRLLTHNMLSCNIKGVTNGFPLIIQDVQKVVEKPVELNPEFLRNMFQKVEWKALSDAAKSLGYAKLPESADASMLDSPEFLQRFHHALLELHLEEGSLVCPETGRKFPVNKGIPNMLLHEDEV